MLGAIIGDFVGSVYEYRRTSYEYRRTREKDFALIHPASSRVIAPQTRSVLA